MPKELKRKNPLQEEHNNGTSPKRRFEEAPDLPATEDVEAGPTNETLVDRETGPEESSIAEDAAAQRARERQERFKALQSRQSQSRNQNRKEAVAEAQRQSVDPHMLSALNRKHAIASHKLLEAETIAAGEDFERKRAWDWTVEESEKWDKRMEKKEKHRNNVAFQDYREEARKAYKTQMRDLKPDVEAYEKEKADAVKRAAESGGLEIVETDDGELLAVDKDGVFYSTANSTDFVQNKPDKAAVDRLVNELKKTDDLRMKKRKERGRDEEDGDVTYINEKNKQFNQKLARFYNKYTTEIRESFERGTAI